MAEESCGNDQSGTCAAVAGVCPGRPRAPGPAAGRCPGCRAGPGGAFEQLQALRPRAPAPGRRAAAGTRRQRTPRWTRYSAAQLRTQCRPSRSILALGGADHHGAVLPRNDVDGDTADQAADGGASARAAGAGGRRAAGCRRAPGATATGVPPAGPRGLPPPAVGHHRFAGEHRSAAGQPDTGHGTVCPLQRHALSATANPSRAGNGRAMPLLAGRGWPGRPEALYESPGIHLVVRRSVEGAGNGGAEQRFPAPGLADGRAVPRSSPLACCTPRRSISACRSAASAPTARVGVVRYPESAA